MFILFALAYFMCGCGAIELGPDWFWNCERKGPTIILSRVRNGILYNPLSRVVASLSLSALCIVSSPSSVVNKNVVFFYLKFYFCWLCNFNKVVLNFNANAGTAAFLHTFFFGLLNCLLCEALFGSFFFFLNRVHTFSLTISSRFRWLSWKPFISHLISSEHCTFDNEVEGKEKESDVCNVQLYNPISKKNVGMLHKC